MTDSTTPATEPSLRDTAPIRASASNTLTWGFRVSATILAIGLIVTLLRGDDIETEATGFTSLVPNLLDGEGSAIVSLAILAMMITPVFTVITVAAGFFRIQDRRFGKISLVVLGVLAVSLIASFFK
jgi:uncharacterized membrane protein